MKVLVALDHRFRRTPDGAVWTQGTVSYSFWTRYLRVFDSVEILARAQDVQSVADPWRRVDGDGVSFIPVPYYVGPEQYILRLSSIRTRVKNAVLGPKAVILRVPSRVASVAYYALLKTQHPYGVEVVGDPYDAFSPGAVRHPLRPVFRWWLSRELRGQCYNACCASYVTSSALQRRYPANPRAFVTHYSSIELPDNVIASAPREKRRDGPVRLIFVGTLEQMYKGPDIVIEAVAHCARKGLDLNLTIVGDGKYRAQLEKQATRLGVRDRVHFAGHLPRSLVWKRLDEADVFVLPSRQEGLPRAMIEAMARGLPCIGTNVGGIPELLASEDLVPPRDSRALARKLEEVTQSPGRMAEMSRRNLAKAREYSESVLTARRDAFYMYLKEVTHRWMTSEGA